MTAVLPVTLQGGRVARDGYEPDQAPDRRLEEETVGEHLARAVPHRALRQLLCDEVIANIKGDSEPDRAIGVTWVLAQRDEAVAAIAAAAALDPGAQLLFRAGRKGQVGGLGKVWQGHIVRRDADAPLIVPLFESDLEVTIRHLCDVSARLSRSLILLVDRQGMREFPDMPPGRIVAVHDADHLVARALCRLNLLKGEDFTDEGAANDIVKAWAREQTDWQTSLFQDLIAPNSARLIRRYWDWKRIDPVASSEMLCAASLETDPRPAVARFLVAHFANLSPFEFGELAEPLLAASPQRRFAAWEGRPADALTDEVLKSASIGFAFGEVDERLFAAFETVAPQRTAEMMRRAFQQIAPLLRERLVGALRDGRLLGHVSSSIADDYRKLEIDLLKQSAGDSAFVARRLRGIIFGAHAAAATLGDLLPGLDRAPELVLAVTDQQCIAPAELLNRLTDMRGVDPALHTLHGLLNAHLNWQFWSRRRLPLTDFPAWTQTGCGDAVRGQRLHYLAYLRRTLLTTSAEAAGPTGGDEPEPGGQGEEAMRVAASDSLAIDSDESGERLLAEAAGILAEGGDIRSPDPDHLSARLYALALVDVAKPLQHRTWAMLRADIGSMLLPEPLIRAALGPTFAAWLGGVSQPDDYELSGQDLYLSTDVLLEALLAKSALGMYETELLQLWLEDAGMSDLDFAGKRLWRGDRGDPGAALSDTERRFVGRLAGLLPLLPVLLAMAGERAVPDALAGWLVRRSGPDIEPPLIRLRDAARDAEELQHEWALFLRKWVIPWRETQGASADRLLEDRRDAIGVLRQALADLRPD